MSPALQADSLPSEPQGRPLGEGQQDEQPQVLFQGRPVTISSWGFPSTHRIHTSDLTEKEQFLLDQGLKEQFSQKIVSLFPLSKGAAPFWLTETR